jgi:hypothetical protein
MRLCVFLQSRVRLQQPVEIDDERLIAQMLQGKLTPAVRDLLCLLVMGEEPTDFFYKIVVTPDSWFGKWWDGSTNTIVPKD